MCFMFGAALPPVVASGCVLLPSRSRNSGQELPGAWGLHLLFSSGMVRANPPRVVKEEETQLGRRRGLGITK